MWIADDAAENDDNPSKDGDPSPSGNPNGGAGVLTLRAESFGPMGAHHVIETTISKTQNVEMERGYTGQRGQDEQNRRARKAAVQTPGAGPDPLGDVVRRHAGAAIVLGQRYGAHHLNVTSRSTGGAGIAAGGVRPGDRRLHRRGAAGGRGAARSAAVPEAHACRR